MTSSAHNMYFHTKSKPIKEAINTLNMLYDWKKNQTTEKPTFENFYPVDLEQVVKLLGWELDRVEIAGYSKSFDPLDAVAYFEDKKITLSMQPDISEGRRNFSLAHEIGHIVLHHEDGKKLLMRTRSMRRKKTNFSYSYDPYEVEADRFAAELLMPQNAVRRLFQKVFDCSEILVDSVLARKIVEMHDSKFSIFDKISRQLLSEVVAAHSSDSENISLIEFFDVTFEAMANRLKELRLVL